MCGSKCNSGLLLNHHLPPLLIHETAAADYLLIGRSLLTVTVTHPRCSACSTVFNGRLAEHNSAHGCSDHFQSMSWVPGDAAGWCQGSSRQRRWGDDLLVPRVSVRHGCPLLARSASVRLMANNLQCIVAGVYQCWTERASITTTVILLSFLIWCRHN